MNPPAPTPGIKETAQSRESTSSTLVVLGGSLFFKRPLTKAVLLAWLMLGESVNPVQILGFILSLAGGLAVSLLKTT